MSYQNTSYDTVNKDYYQYNITMFFFYCDYVSEKKTHTQMNTIFFKSVMKFCKIIYSIILL